MDVERHFLAGVRTLIRCVLTLTLILAWQVYGQSSVTNGHFLVPPLSSLDIKSSPLLLDEIKTLDGSTYKTVKVVDVDAGGLLINYSDIPSGGMGTAKIRFENLPTNVRERFAACEKSVLIAKHESEDRVRSWNTAGEKANAETQCQIGDMYFYGRGVAKDYAEAAKWYRFAAMQGDAYAQNIMGFMFLAGLGVPKNLVESARLFREAAEHGCADAQFNLGNAFVNGDGVAQDYVEADKWYNLAVAGHRYQQGLQMDVEAKRDLEQQMSPWQIAEAQRLSSLFTPKRSGSGSVRKDPALRGAISCATAFYVTEDGYALTALHAVNHAAKISLRTSTGTWAAKLVKADVANDLALLKTSGHFAAMPLQSSSEASLGEGVFTVGFPNPVVQGLEPKLTSGEISSLSGARDDPRSFQISVPVQPGNSGGPLVNLRGNVVGIVTARLNDIATLDESGSLPQNVNYAIKSSYALLLFDSVPELSAKLKKPRTQDLKLEAVAKQVEKATAMVLAY